jgi:hypothetical protein
MVKNSSRNYDRFDVLSFSLHDFRLRPEGLFLKGYIYKIYFLLIDYFTVLSICVCLL